MHTPSTLIGAIAGLALLVSPASAATYAGPVDVNTACIEQYGSGYRASRDGDSAGDWSCVHLYPVDIDAYCKLTYGIIAYADAQGGGIYDWGCFYSTAVSAEEDIESSR